MQETLRGEVVRWRMPPKADSQWHIIEVLDDAGALHTVTGCSLPRVGAVVELSGEWQQHERWGAQFHARSVLKSRRPLSAEGVARWLRERVPGIGAKRAQQLLESFGGDATQLWEAAAQPDITALTSRGLSPELAFNLREALESEGAEGEYQALMHGWGMTQRQIAKVKRHWSLEQASDLLSRNPYLLADHIDGFGFNRADEVARKLGIAHTDPVRVNAALLHFIDRHAGQGHVFVDEPLFRVIARETRLPVERLLDGVQALRDAQRLTVEEGSRIYLPSLHVAECTVADDLRERFAAYAARQAGEPELEPEELPRIVESSSGHETSDPWQQRAIELLCDMSAPIVFVTGGPGTGKTTVLRHALARLRAQGVSVMLAAPTGKAAKRMTEATGQRASTLHSLLGYRSLASDVDCDVCREQASDFDYTPINAAQPRMVIVDESSMVDIGLWAALALSARGVRLAFVGDANQLPPVGPGQPFADALSRAPAGAVVRLRTVFRSKGEWVKAAAPQILAGRLPKLEDGPGLRWVAVERADAVGMVVLELVQGLHDLRPHFTVAAAQALGHMPILTPQRTGSAGVAAINKALHELLNPPEPGAPSIDLEDGTALREGSWVMCGKNDARKGVCNGDTGYVVSLDETGLALTLDGGSNPARYTRAEAREQLRLAYASTVHKSQGSEYPWVAVVCHSTHKRMLTRRLLYTAVTRAKEGVVVIGDRPGFEWAIENAREVQRCTWLPQRIGGV